MTTPKLLDQVKSVARLKHLSLKTEQAYAYHIKRFILFHEKRHPTKMGEDEIRKYLSYLAVERNVAASTQNVALAKDIDFSYNQVWVREGKGAKDRVTPLPAVLKEPLRQRLFALRPREETSQRAALVALAICFSGRQALNRSEVKD